MATFAQSGQTGRAPGYRYGVLVPGFAVLAIASSDLLGWIFQPEIFKRLVNGLGEMKPNSALGFLFLAIALLLLDNFRKPLRAISRGCAILALLIGVLTALEHLTGSSLGIDQLFLSTMPVAGTLQPGQMSVVTSLNLISLGSAILLIDLRFGPFLPSAFLTWITGSLSFLTLTGYAYDAESLYRLRLFSHVSLLTSLTFLILCTAIMFARPQRGGAAILLAHDLGGQAARRLMPAAIFVPFAISLIIVRLHSDGTYGVALMVFLFVVAPVAVFVPLVLFSASLLSRMEREREQSEDELRVSTQRYSSVVASAMDAIITLDESLRVIVFNQAAEKMFGCPAWEALGNPLNRFLPFRFREAHDQHVLRFGEAGVTTRSMVSPGLLSAVRANGEEFPIEATVSQVRVAGQKLYTVILRDITERKRAEETLRESEARFRSIYEQAAVGIEQVALDGRILMVNAALCRMLGYEEAELRRKRTEDITHPDDRARELALLHSMQREHRNSYEMEKRYLHRNGAVVWINVSSSMVNDAAGVPLYRISVVQNVTERKRAEDQLKQAQKMEAIGRLAGGVAHDFNTLLNVMLGYSELLLAELPQDDARREKVMQIKNSGAAGALLTRQLLAFSRKQPVAQQVLDLRDVASRMTPILEQLLNENIELSVKCSGDLCPVKVDPGQLQQLVLNLVANAGDSMPDGGQINIEVKSVEIDHTFARQHPSLHVGRYAMLAISDSGAGMDAETVSHIFEPFFTTKDPGKGTGLGLATVYGIIKRNGGDIWVYSEVGVGTIFRVYLPLTSEPLQSEAPPAVLAQGAVGGGGETILLVEDSAALRELTKVILLRAGYNVLEAEDGVVALEVAQSFPGIIHLLLSDVVMPRMRGPKLAEKMLQLRPSIAVVFLSGYTEEVIAQTDGISGFTLVEKPYTAEGLMNSIRRALRERLSPVTFRVP